MSVVQGPQPNKTVEVSKFDQTKAPSLTRDTLTRAPRGAGNGVALDTNSCWALPLHGIYRLSRGWKGGP